MPQRDAEIHAEALAEQMNSFTDKLVTREYLDLRLAELEARFEALLEARLGEKVGPINVKLARHDIMLAAIFVSVVIPLVRDFLLQG